MVKNIEAVVKAITGFIVSAGGAVITVAACGGHQEINPQNYVQQAMIYGGLIICAAGVAIIEWGSRQYEKNNRFNQGDNKENQDSYTH